MVALAMVNIVADQSLPAVFAVELQAILEAEWVLFTGRKSGDRGLSDQRYARDTELAALEECTPPLLHSDGLYTLRMPSCQAGDEYVIPGEAHANVLAPDSTSREGSIT